MIYNGVAIWAPEDPLNAWKVIPTHCQGAQGHFGSHLTEIEQLESFNTLKILKGLDMLEKWRIWKNEFWGW